MTDLSPAAQAVLEAAGKQTDLDFHYAPQIAAAALRAAGEQISYLMPGSPTADAFDGGYVTGMARALDELEFIATELENR